MAVESPPRFEGEDDVWYGRFITYYLPQGFRASLVKAYNDARQVENPVRFEKNGPAKSASSAWYSARDKYQWQRRASDYWSQYADDKLEHREGIMRLTLGVIADDAPKMAEALVNIALGKVEAKKDQLKAIETALGIFGLSKNGGAAVRTTGADTGMSREAVAAAAMNPEVVGLAEEMMSLMMPERDDDGD